MAEKINYWQLDKDKTAKLLNTDLVTGLSSQEIKDRLDKYGYNRLEEAKGRGIAGIFLDQFKDFMIIVLLIAAVISGLLGDVADTVAIIVIVVLNAVIGFVQEYRAEKAMAALKKMAAHSALVIREGNAAVIPASEIVPGDIVILESGKVVPADLRLFEVSQLKMEEAALTGESVPVEKSISLIEDSSIPLGDRKNMVYKGTSVSYGRGKGIVIATGMETELGKIASMIQDEEEVKTPLQKRLAAFGQRLAYVILAICVIFFGIGVIMVGEGPLTMLLTAISLAVAAIPEALPAVVTISLAIGARKLVKQNALIRKLPAVETLGSVTYICSDKTGTLTMNRMAVEEVYIEGSVLSKEKMVYVRRETGNDPYAVFLTAMALNNDAMEDADGKFIGDPTEIALYRFSLERGFGKKEIENVQPRMAEIPFDSDRKCMTTFHKDPSGKGFVSFTKGAFDVLINKSQHILTQAGRIQLEKEAINSANEKLSADGLRVLCIAMRKWDDIPDKNIPEVVEAGLTIIGLVGMMDPPREEAREAIGLCRSAGIVPVMITGDHPLTAKTIAKRLDIVGDDAASVITGSELDKLSLEEFEERVEHIRVYARVAPEQKLKIVKALQDRGQFVAMTGDGVNDAPALKRADIGVAMGITGTDVSKEAAHMILLDDNFATIVKAVKEGRRIFDNIIKFIKYTMTSNSGEILSIAFAPMMGLPIPLLPIHILWINLVTDGLPGLALAAENAERNVMSRPPRHPKESIFSKGLGIHIVWVGILMAAGTMFTQAYSINRGVGHWQTMTFTVLCLSQMGHAIAVRSDIDSIFTIGIFSNLYLLGATALTFVLQLMITYVPFFQSIFRTEALTMTELAFCLIMSSLVFVAVEIEKYFKRKNEVNKN